MGGQSSWLDARLDRAQSRERRAVRNRTDRCAPVTSADAWIVADPIGCPVCGRDACEDHLPPPTTSTATRRLPLAVYRVRDLINAPRPVEILQGVAWAGCLSVLVSESGTGKTFVLLDIAAAISDGVSWHGRTVQRGSVLYFPFEGDALGVRCRALTETRSRRLDYLRIIPATNPLSPHIGHER